MADKKADQATEEDERYAAPFAEVLRMMGDGRLHAELTEKWHDLVAAVNDHQKPGSLTLTFKVDIETKMTTPVLVITDAVTMKAPQPARPKSMFYTDKHGNVSRDHPNMEPMLDEGLKVVERKQDDEPIKKVSAK